MGDYILPSKLTIGFSAFLSLVLVTILTKDEINSSLIVFVYSSGIAIPTFFAHILLFLEFISREEKTQPNTPLFYLMIATLYLGYITGLIAVAAVFWYFSKFASLVFVVSVLVWFYLLYRYLFRKYGPPQ